ncbi:MAG: hypothetical protein COW39_10040 [Comamonadaceae bacterium CG17_big_fil_post_rev_8_21_14_2_50_60_13]|nr:MAG: hypothetical protein COW39_10040 [Comamonadaceae bacterium CG17_big_fil_post_rev_8_21_14_2_50_60_13]
MKGARTLRHTVLYIEDNPSNIKLVTRLLGRRQHVRCLVANTPELGIELALAHRPTLTLLDINLPGMNGYQVLELFQAEESLRSMPVIALTASATSSDMALGMSAGFTDYLTKPLDIEKFYEVVDRVLAAQE